MMSPFRFSDIVKFEPWIDNERFCDQRPRLLFVGESHYARRSEAGNRNLTRQVVNRAREGKLTKKSGLRFFTNIAAMANGELIPNEKKKDWWSTVAFYNYIQVPIGNKPRTRFKLTRFAEAHEAFHEVLSAVQPDIVVILGRRIWKHMSASNAEKIAPLNVDRIDPMYRELWEYRTQEGKTAIVFHVKHPSAGFNFRKFCRLLTEAMSRVPDRSGLGR